MKIKLIFLIIIACLCLSHRPVGAQPSRSSLAPDPRKGIQPGAPVDNSGNIIISEEIADQLAASNAAYVRLNLKNPWCTDTAEFYAAYDTIIGRLRARGLTVIALLSNEFLCGTQDDWNEDAWEVTGGDSFNTYLDQFGYQAGRVIAHYRNHYDVRHWEIWNEPNCYSTAPGEGCSYIWPSIFSRLLGHVYTQAKYYNEFDVEIVSGGLLAHNLFGSNQASAGADYLQDTYEYGINRGDWSWIMDHAGSYPLDHVGYHIYLGSTGAELASDVANYLDWIHAAYVDYEGSGTPKEIFITELGWRSDGLGEEQQAANLTTAFDVTTNTSYVTETTWFFLRDQDSWAELWGLLRVDGSPKPAWYAFGGSPPPVCSTTPLPVPTDGWRLEIWDNIDFSGSPAEIRNDAAGQEGFQFVWGEGRASECAGYDQFAIRFTRQAYFPTPGDYTFLADSDDGLRLWLDEQVLIDTWNTGGAHSAQISLAAGWHDLRLDYHEEAGNAHAQLSWQEGIPPTTTATSTITPTSTSTTASATIPATSSSSTSTTTSIPSPTIPAIPPTSTTTLTPDEENNAALLPGSSAIPASLSAGETATVTIRVQNTGTSTWHATNLYRLGALSDNQATWGNWACGGYSNSITDTRAFLCHDVPPGETHDFSFQITIPEEAHSPVVLSVRMVQDGVAWFGEPYTWQVETQPQVFLPAIKE